MKTAIRRYLITRRMRKLAQHLQFLSDEEERNLREQVYVQQLMVKLNLEVLNLSIKSRREMMV